MKVNKKSQEHIKEQREPKKIKQKICVKAEAENRELLQNFNIRFISSYVLLTL